jgi:hypothetical protein
MTTFEATSRQKNYRCSSLFLFVLSVGLLFTQMRPAYAADDLLDPTKIGSARKSSANQGLLDPSQIGAKAAKSPVAKTQKHTPSYARDMAGSVVSSMDSLTRSAATLSDEVTKLDKIIRELAVKLKTLQEEMAAKLEEYRLGLFCSGCGRTKSEILATGDTFPHPGQTIIRPTPEQIAAKERELQAPIDRISRELKEARAKRTKTIDERDEAMQQIDAGLALWKTSISFENSIILQDDHVKETTYQAALAKAENQLSALKVASNKKASPANARESKKWEDIKLNLNKQRVHERRATRDDLARAATAAERERDELNAYFSRGTLNQLITLAASIGFVGPDGDFNGLGGLYRMGSYSLSGRDEVLPSVNSFVIAFRNSPRNLSSSKGTLPTPDVPLPQQLKNKLKDLLKCDPEAGEKCAPRKLEPLGTRG